MYRLGQADTCDTHANNRGFGLTYLSEVCSGFMPPQLKTNKNKTISATVCHESLPLKHVKDIIYRQDFVKIKFLKN